MRHCWIGVALAALAFGLAGCAPSRSTSAVSAQPVAFACPAEGTKTTRAGTSTTYTWHKPDAADPVVCPATDPSGTESRWLYGWYRVPTTDEDAKRKALVTAFAGGEGCYTVTTRPANLVGFTADVNSSYVYEHCWRQDGREKSVVNGRPTELLTILFTEEGRAGNTFAADRRIMFDLGTHAITEVAVVNRRGTPITGFRNVVTPAPGT